MIEQYFRRWLQPFFAVCLIVAPFFVLPVGAQQLVLNINQVPAAPDPDEILSTGSRVYFSVDDELWTVDATGSDMRRINVVQQEPYTGFDRGAGFLGSIKDKATFTAEATTPDNYRTEGLWVTDGTEDGTFPLIDAEFGIRFSSGPTIEGRVYFVFEQDQRAELWMTDGTRAGTTFVVDLGRGINPDYRNFARLDDHLFVNVEGPNLGDEEVWKLHLETHAFESTGISSRTAREILGSTDSFMLLNGCDEVMGCEPWVSDGTQDGTFRLANTTTERTSGPEYIGTVNDRVVFNAWTDEDGWTLWGTDGTVDGTQRLSDQSDVRVELFRQRTATGGELYFGSRDGLWISDGTPDGTRHLRWGDGGVNINHPQNFLSFGGKVFFTASSAAHGFELWKTDGTYAGTHVVSDINAGSASGCCGEMVETNAGIMFSATDGQKGRRLWFSWGTDQETRPIAATSDSTSDNASNPTHFLRMGDRIFFQAADGINGRELWASDGAMSGTGMIRDFAPGAESSDARPRGILGSRVIVTTSTGLFSVDADTDEITELTDPDDGRWTVEDVFIDGENVYFSGSPAGGHEQIWRFDGSTNRVRAITDLPAPAVNQDEAVILGVIGGRILFSKNDGGIFRLYSSEGMPGTSVELADGSRIRPVSGTLLESDRFLFRGEDGVFRTTDGSREGTVSIQLDTQIYFSSRMTPSGGRAFFWAETVDHGDEFWTSDGTSDGTYMLADVCPGACGSYSANLVMPMGNWMVFAVDPGPGTERELWISDGTPAGTHAIHDRTSDILPQGYIRPLAANDEVVFYWAANDEEGHFLLRSDGTPDGAEVVAHLDAVDGGPLIPRDWAAIVDDQLLFSAAHPEYGTELWSIDIDAPPILLDREEQIPSTFSLEQNYPNPFSRSTTIEYSIQRAETVDLVVHDLLGRRVRSVERGPRTPGTYRVHVDAAGLAPGVYFYTLSTPEGKVTRRFTLTR